MAGLGGNLLFPNYSLSEMGRMELRGYRDKTHRKGRPLVPKSMGRRAAKTPVELPAHPVPCLVWFGVGGSSVPEPSTFLTGSPGLFFSIGELWRTTRRFTVSSMRNLGMGKQMIEGRIFEELHFLIEMIKSFKGELGTIPGLSSLVCVTAAPRLTAFPPRSCCRGTFQPAVLQLRSHQRHLRHALWGQV